MKRSKDQAPLIVEPHPEDYSGYPFITLLRYNKETMLTVIDNRTAAVIQGYVLDLCGPERIDEQGIIAIADYWYTNNQEKYPISVEFSRLGVSEIATKIYRSFNVDYVTRVIGPLPQFDTTPTRNPRRRKRKEPPATKRKSTSS